MKKYRILLVDDHCVVREGMKRILEAEADLEVVGEASDGDEVLAALQRQSPDVVMMDISMPGMNGIEATRRLKETHPGVQVLALSVHEEPGYVTEFLQAGAMGYLLKRTPPEELVRAIRDVLAGKLYVDPRISELLIRSIVHSEAQPENPVQDLSEREQRVLRSTALGFATKEIATQLGISVKTVETYKARAMEKLGLKSRVDIVRVAADRGWLAPADSR